MIIIISPSKFHRVNYRNLSEFHRSLDGFVNIRDPVVGIPRRINPWIVETEYVDMGSMYEIVR